MKTKGFSLIEVMVVILIIGLMTAIIAPSIVGQGEEAKKKKAAIDIQALENALNMYRLQNNNYPSTEQGLEALVTASSIEPVPRKFPEEGFITRLPQDPWGSDYQLLNPGEMGTIDIFSNGPDQQPGTDDDVGNWNIEEYLN